MPENTISSVMDMMQVYADSTGTDTADIFKKDKPKVVKEVPKAPEKEWQPDPTLLEGLEELQKGPGLVIDKESFQPDHLGPIDLANVTDDTVRKTSIDQVDELHRAVANIERAKRHLGIKQFQIPQMYHSRIMDAAADNNPTRAFENTVEVLTDLIQMLPKDVSNIEWMTSAAEKPIIPSVPVTHVQPLPDPSPEIPPEEIPTALPPIQITPLENVSRDVQVIIDKRQAPEVIFDSQDLEKLRNARSIELKIIEDRELHYNVLGEPENDIDIVLSQYTRRFNDRAVSLPASRYRCTVTGLSYPEILDLSYSQDLNDLDKERNKWNIVARHVKNASIGPFSDTDDFLRKTSYLDLDYLLWAVLCATCMPQEIVSIDCGKESCKNQYDWIYAPSNLLQMQSISPQTLEEMRITGEASTVKEIEDNYNSSMLRLNNAIELPTSKFGVVFGHISAYTHLNDVYSRMEDLKDNLRLSDVTAIASLTVIKHLLLPSLDGRGHYKVTDPDDIIKVIKQLDELDFHTIDQLITLMITPYQLKFVLSDVVCPKCKTVSSIPVEDISRLVFIVARSLDSTNVALKTH